MITDGITQLGCAWITGCSGHHTGAAQRGDGERWRLIELPVGAGQQHFGEVALQERHQRLAFRIAKAAVEFDHLRPAAGEHQPRIDHPAVVDSPLAQGLHHRLQDDLSHLLQARLIQQWRWRVGPHAAGVGACIAFADAFVVLRRR